jgi:hypothetical protein
MGVMECAGKSEFIKVPTKKLARYVLYKLFLDLSPCFSNFNYNLYVIALHYLAP